jgi:alkylation response protein AidB-like acyl-CoA dehydrogenase
VILTEEQLQLRHDVRQFAESELRESFMAHTRGPEFPEAADRRVGRTPYLGVLLPEELGGMGKGVVDYCVVLEELARVDHNVAWVLDSNISTAKVIAEMGSTEHQEKYIPGLLSGELIPAFALTDVTGGSSLKGMSTVAALSEDGGTYVVNGRKTHLHNADRADFWMVFARSDAGADAFLMDTDGSIELVRKYQPFGFRAAPCYEVAFNDSRIPVSDRLGESGKGVGFAMNNALNYTRVGNASIVIGIARAAMDAVVSYAMRREVAGGTITDQQAVRHVLADVDTKIEAASLLRYQAAALHDAGQDAVKAASQAKLFATEAASEACGKLMRLMGAYGIYEELPFADYYASCKVLELGSGASEVHRNNIASQLLRGYRSQSREHLERWASNDEQRLVLARNQ